MDLFEFAVAMTTYVSEAKYWEGYDALSSAMKASELEEIGERFLLRQGSGASWVHHFHGAKQAGSPRRTGVGGEQGGAQLFG